MNFLVNPKNPNIPVITLNVNGLNTQEVRIGRMDQNRNKKTILKNPNICFLQEILVCIRFIYKHICT